VKSRPAGKQAADVVSGGYKWGFHDEARYLYRTEKGLSRKVVEEIAGIKEEPQWMRDFRLEALAIFEKKPLPPGGPTCPTSISTRCTTMPVPATGPSATGRTSLTTSVAPSTGWASRRRSGSSRRCGRQYD
jgi:hypothetical protein